MATAPIDCTGWRSKTGLKVVPPLIDFHTPPLAAPTNTVTRPSFSIASKAAMRPLMVAEPMLRIGKPEMVAASNLMACWATPVAHTSNAVAGSSSLLNQREQRSAVAVIESPLGYGTKSSNISGYGFLVRHFFSEAGTANSELLSVTLTSIFSTLVVCH